MPIYSYQCECGEKVERLQGIGDEAPKCSSCGVEMIKGITHPAIIRVLSKGGHPVRSKGYKEGYSKEVLRDVSPETYA